MNTVWVIFRYSKCSADGENEYTVAGKNGLPVVEKWSHVLYDTERQLEIVLSKSIIVNQICDRSYRTLETVCLDDSEVKTVRRKREMAFKVLSGKKERKFQVSFTMESDAAEFNERYLAVLKEAWRNKREGRMKELFLRDLKKIN